MNRNHYSEIDGGTAADRWLRAYFNVHVNDLDSRAKVLQWYLDLNTGGTVHTKEEIDKVQLMLAEAEVGALS